MRTRLKNFWMALSLRATLTITFLAFGALVISISSTLQLISSLQTQQVVIASNQHLIADEAARSVSSFILMKFNDLETAIWIVEPSSASTAEQKLMLESLLGFQPAFSKILLLNGNNQMLAQATRLPQVLPGKVSQLDTNLLITIHRKERYISPVHIDPITNEPMVTMAVPVIDVFGDFQGSLVADVNLKFMWDLVNKLKVGNTGVAYVVDGEGNLIAFGDTARVLRGENVSRLEAVREFIDSTSPESLSEISIYQGINDRTVAGTFVPLRTPDWAVVTELPWEEAYQDIIRQIIVSFGITLFMAILAGLIGILVARQLAIPIIHLMETSTRIASGERFLHSEVNGPSEVAGLARAFNSMTAQLQQSLESLEEQVAEVRQAEESLREANRTLQESERNYREVFNATSDALLIQDESARILDVNDRMCIMFGYDHDSTRSLSVGDISLGQSPYSQPEAEENVRRASKEGTIIFEWQSKRANGELFWSEVALHGVEIAGEKRVIASIRDISHRIKVEQALRESEERLQQIASSLREVIWLRDVHTRQVLYVNPAFEELTGRTCQNFYEDRDIIKNATHPDDMEFVNKSLDRRSEGTPLEIEHRLVHVDGSIRWVSSRSFPVRNEAGKVYRWATIMEDITKRTQAEAEIRRLNEELEKRVRERTTQLEAANKELEAFSYSVSHDLRAPLRAINGFADILVEEYGTHLDDEAKRICGVIQRQSLRMGKLIDDLLALARLGRTTMHLTWIDMDMMVNSIFDELTTAEQRLRIDFHSETLPQTRADPVLIRQVWMNLIDNAIKFSAHKERSSIEIRGETEPRENVYRILDNGAGFNAKYADKLFDVFQRLHTNKEFEGTGVGLAIVRRAIERHGGRVWADATEGQGATFSFSLPNEKEVGN
jgi:PAS domain S-box-containing protein